MRVPRPLQNLLAIAVVLGLGLPLWLWIRDVPDPPRVLRPEPGPIPVHTASVRAADVRLTLEAYGTLQPARRSVLAVELAGRVARHLEPWHPGRRVVAGEELLALDDSLARLELTRAEALRTEAERLRDLRRIEREQAPAREAMAEQNLALRRREEERIASLVESGGASPSLLDQTRIAALAAELARQDAGDLRRVAAAAEASAEAGVATAEAAVARAREDLARHVLRAPFDGELADRGPDLGSYLAPGTPVVTVVDRSHLRLVVHVPEHESGRLAPGAPAEVFVPARPDWRAGEPLRVRAVAPEADPATRAVAVELDVPAGEPVPLAVGLFARAELELGREARGIVVLRRHLTWERDRAVAFVVRTEPDGRAVAERRELELGPAVGEGFLVRAGLADGDELITGPLERLRANAPVVRRASGPQTGDPLDWYSLGAPLDKGDKGDKGDTGDAVDAEGSR